VQIMWEQDYCKEGMPQTIQYMDPVIVGKHQSWKAAPAATIDTNCGTTTRAQPWTVFGGP